MNSDSWLPPDPFDPTYLYGCLVIGRCPNCHGEGVSWVLEDGLPPGDCGRKDTCSYCKGVGYGLADLPEDLTGWTRKRCPTCSGDGAVMHHSSMNSVPVEAWFEACKSCGGEREILMPPTEMNAGDELDQDDTPF